jgi:biofilm PGA synthesis N-glycosyltransferase PgaC
MIVFILTILFWVSSALVIYTYILYPCIIFCCVMLFKKQKHFPDPQTMPKVSLICSVYNEENVLQEKLLNLASLMYPIDNFEIIIGSDGSTDGSNEILLSSNIPNLHTNIFPVRRGKASVLNDLMKTANGEIVIFTDANTMYQNDTVSQLVSHFSDLTVGGVCGNLILNEKKDVTGEIGETSYWKFENIVKQLESDFQTLIGATGGIYAIRRSLFKPLPSSKAIVDDFLIPIEVVKKGYRVIYNSKALAYENSTGSVIREFKRKVRIGASNFSSIAEYRTLLHPRHGFVAFALWSHKIIRWFVPIILIAIFILTGILAHQAVLYQLIFLGEIFFIAISIFGLLAELSHFRIGFLGIPYYFTAMNTALLIGFIKFIIRRQRSTWDIIR